MSLCTAALAQLPQGLVPAVDVIARSTPLWPVASIGEALSDNDLNVWRKHAYLCAAHPAGSFVASPSKTTVTTQENFPAAECNDGDQTLFNGLLCAVGERIGCDAVRDAQGANGRWFRSPARRWLWDHACYSRIQEGSSAFLGRCAQGFSPDMVLGMYAFVLATGDKAALERWLGWVDTTIDDTRVCKVSDPKDCIAVPWPRVCTADLGFHHPDMSPTQLAGYLLPTCSLRPWDALDMVTVTRAMGATVPARLALWMESQRVLMDTVMPGHQLLFSSYEAAHFPLHLDAVRVLLRMLIVNPTLSTSSLPAMPVAVQPQHLAGALINQDQTIAWINANAVIIAARDRANPFYQVLAHGPTPAVRDLLLARCPTPSMSAASADHSTWLWEKESSFDNAASSMRWDCIFVGHLYNRMRVREDLAKELLGYYERFADASDVALAAAEQALVLAAGAQKAAKEAADAALRHLKEAEAFVSTGYARSREDLTQTLARSQQAYQDAYNNYHSQYNNVLTKARETFAQVRGDIDNEIKRFCDRSAVDKIVAVAVGGAVGAALMAACVNDIGRNAVQNLLNHEAKIRGYEETSNFLHRVKDEMESRVLTQTRQLAQLAAKYADMQAKLTRGVFAAAVSSAENTLKLAGVGADEARSTVRQARVLNARVRSHLAIWKRRPS